MEKVTAEDTEKTQEFSKNQAKGKDMAIIDLLSRNALTVLQKRYLRKNEDRQVVETPDEMLRRVANHVAQGDRIHDRKAAVTKTARTFYNAMAALEFLPNSPTLMNAGAAMGQLAACYVLHMEDSMPSIFDTLKYAALIHQSGGGTGFNFSTLRPRGDMVNTTRGTASGPLSFMKVFNAATEEIKQGGTRRGANMAVLRVDHPDVEEFITSKRVGSLHNFNISVAITDEFMAAVTKNDDFPLRFGGKVYRVVKAREIWDLLATSAWETGDPGVIFIDEINRHNPTPELGPIEATNPCGEQPLLSLPGGRSECCTLGAINLARVVREGDIDWRKLGKTVDMAVHFLDNVVDVNSYPLPGIEELSRQNRKIGLGVMGWAHCLLKIGLRYDSEEALDKAREVMSFIRERAGERSALLAAQRGPFPNFERSIHAGGVPLRNAALTTVAPTGTVSIIAGCSSGIEPIFAVGYTRKSVLDGESMMETDPVFEEMARAKGFYSEELMQEVAETGLATDVPGVPQEIQDLFRTAHQISAEWHIRMQAAFQTSGVDAAVSKTVNLPQSATVEDVAKAYLLAWEMRCKGLTVYRYGCKDVQVLYVGSSEEEPARSSGRKIVPRSRPAITKGITERVRTSCGNIYVTVNYDDNGICEVFSAIGKTGGCASAQLEAITRLTSYALRSGIDVNAVVKQLAGIRCPSPIWDEGKLTLSCADAIAKTLKKHISRESPETQLPASESLGPVVGMCPDCSQPLRHSEGCVICMACGFTKCE